MNAAVRRPCDTRVNVLGVSGGCNIRYEQAELACPSPADAGSWPHPRITTYIRSRGKALATMCTHKH